MWVDLLVFPVCADLLFHRQCWSFCQKGRDRGSSWTIYPLGPTILRLILTRHKYAFSGWVTTNFQHAFPWFALNWAPTGCQLTSLQGRNALDCKCLSNAFAGTFLLDSALHWGCVSFPEGMLRVLHTMCWSFQFKDFQNLPIKVRLTIYTE